MEELGELAHAHLKGLQGIRHTSPEIESMKIDAVADIVIFLSDYCTANGLDFQDAVEQTWNRVRQRDWKSDPLNADLHVPGSSAAPATPSTTEEMP